MASKTKGLNKATRTTTPKTSSAKPSLKAVTSATLKPKSKALKRTSKPKNPPSSTTEATTESRDPPSSASIASESKGGPHLPSKEVAVAPDSADSVSEEDGPASNSGGLNEEKFVAIQEEEDATSEEDEEVQDENLIPGNVRTLNEPSAPVTNKDAAVEEVDSENTPSSASEAAEDLDSEGEAGEASESQEEEIPKDSILAQTLETIGSSDSFNGPLKSLFDSHIKLVAFVVYTKASTPGCTKQCQAFSTVANEAKKIGCRLLGLSPDGLALQENFHTQQKLEIDLVVNNQKVFF
eukprot:Protomagalhaensia_sp_Gyna_25__4237@NODE_385_length_3627_cov_157_976031_g296_i0_p2_GENE_NODE_385_length_3627_cov_157_976031_g296_i0NODE_385_length_3627_cov_157_976031_g296_i0_p2_ORF_typecomplete_len295_score71_38AhpCTSA/PF00578_21/5_2e07Redoxin/PF08534_10/0_039Hamartin/PF04388_12/0_82CDC27/PF09507_10/2_6DUF3340/PF11818_8/3_3e03DUF3340/PF11818_8/0_089_NODE_385_length_3627_cov_157_976031_g296_i025863470